MITITSDRRRTTRLLATCATFALLLGACGGDDASDSSDDASGSPTASTAPIPNATTPETTESPAPATSQPPTPETTESPTPATSQPPAPETTAVPATAFPVTIEHALGSTEILAMPETVVSASATMTGHLLAIGVPVTAAQALPPQSPLSDDNGFMKQWGEAATEAGLVAIPGPEVNIEAIAAARPDLIIGNSFGGDAVTQDVYDLLSQIAPTIVIDHSAMEWQELAVILAEATGRETEAAAVVSDFNTHVADVAANISADNSVVVGVITEGGVNIFTPESSHGKLLTSLGLTVVALDGGNLEGEQGSQTRADVVSVSPELIPDEFGDATVLFVFADESTIGQALDLYPTLAAIPAAQEGRLIPLGIESFRLDAYSARLVVDALAAQLS